MRIVQRQIIWDVCISLLFVIVLGAVFLEVFPISDWSELWRRKIIDIPIIIFIPSVSVTCGILSGIVMGQYWRNQLKAIEKGLADLEDGRQIDYSQVDQTPDLLPIVDRMMSIQKEMVEKAKLSQKLATEKAEDLEEKIQEMISEERNRLARELHDSVSQQLFAASMLMSAINETKPMSDDRETKQLKMVEHMIHQSQLEMRALLLHLRPVALKGKSLREGIEELLVELSQKVTMKIVWKVEPLILDKGIEDHLFRILQESISNTLRHSQATKLDVLLIMRDDFVILRVVDDGVGFDVETEKAGSYGLQNMYERALEIGGTMKIVSMRNKGTRLEVKVPIITKEVDCDD